MTALHHSPIESKRFGLRVFRGVVDAVDAPTLAAEIDRQRVDVAILRVPARAVGSLGALRQHALMPIVADTLVHYETRLGPRTSRDTAQDAVTLRAATLRDASLLEAMSREIFSDYVTHYHANPLFAPAKILDGYGEWAASHVRAGETGAAAWLVESAGEIVGFSCYREDAVSGLAVGVLNGILPAFRGRGIYRGMLHAMLLHFGAAGMQTFAIATQVQNIAVQRIWASQGLLLRGAENTVHINALRDARAASAHADSDPAGRPTPRAAARAAK